uniref:Uncharacterized protein n=1 Tax=Ditylenchus dipsaci TaxID=166011 RepID=A0A915EJ44_9BILA
MLKPSVFRSILQLCIFEHLHFSSTVNEPIGQKEDRRKCGDQVYFLLQRLADHQDSLQKALRKHGLVQTVPKGEVFDPENMMLFYEVSSDSAKPGDVVEVLSLDTF